MDAISPNLIISLMFIFLLLDAYACTQKMKTVSCVPSYLTDGGPGSFDRHLHAYLRCLLVEIITSIQVRIRALAGRYIRHLKKYAYCM